MLLENAHETPLLTCCMGRTLCKGEAAIKSVSGEACERLRFCLVLKVSVISVCNYPTALHSIFLSGSGRSKVYNIA